MRLKKIGGRLMAPYAAVRQQIAGRKLARAPMPSLRSKRSASEEG